MAYTASSGPHIPYSVLCTWSVIHPHFGCITEMQQACTRALWICLCLHSGKEPGGAFTCFIWQSKKLAPRAMTAQASKGHQQTGMPDFGVFWPLWGWVWPGHNAVLAWLSMTRASACPLSWEQEPQSWEHPAAPQCRNMSLACQTLEMCLIKVPDSKTETRTGVRWDLLQPHYSHNFWQVLKYKNPYIMPRN